jgi:hypothetical protein
VAEDTFDDVLLVWGDGGDDLHGLAAAPADAGIVAPGLSDELGPVALAFAEELGIVVNLRGNLRGRTRELGWRERRSRSAGDRGRLEIGRVRRGGQGETGRGVNRRVVNP